MDIFTILAEAKTPSSSNSLTIKEDNKIDYSGGIGMDSGANDAGETTAPEPTEPTDYSAETDNALGADEPAEPTEDPGATQDDQAAGGEEPAADDAGVTEPTDYTMSDMGADDFGVGGQDQTADQQDTTTSTDEEPKEEDEATKLNKLLLNDFTDLYYSIQANSSKLDTIDSVDIVTTQILIRAKDQLSKLQAYTYNYIIRHFVKSSYAQNLYAYKNIIALYKISIEMVKKIRKSNTVK